MLLAMLGFARPAVADTRFEVKITTEHLEPTTDLQLAKERITRVDRRRFTATCVRRQHRIICTPDLGFELAGLRGATRLEHTDHRTVITTVVPIVYRSMPL